MDEMKNRLLLNLIYLHEKSIQKIYLNKLLIWKEIRSNFGIKLTQYKIGAPPVFLVMSPFKIFKDKHCFPCLFGNQGIHTISLYCKFTNLARRELGWVCQLYIGLDLPRILAGWISSELYFAFCHELN